MSDEPLLLPAPDEPLLLPAPKRPGGGRPSGSPEGGGHRRLFVIAAIVFVALLLIGWLFHHHQASLAKEANEKKRERLPEVSVIDVKSSSATAELLLPGSVSPITEASLYARSSGYVRARYADIGDTVHRGQVLAEIDSPDLDQQVEQGRAAVAQARQQLGQAQATVVDARARVDLAQVTYQRVAVLGRDDAVAQQEVDQRRQELDTAKATLVSDVANVGASRDNVRASEANAQRLVVLQRYEKLIAPFDGIVTARNVDVGALIGGGGGAQSSGSGGGTSSSEGPSTSSSSGSSGSGGSTSSTTTMSGGSGGQADALFRVAQVDRLRVFVSVPQENADSVEPGRDAKVFVAGHGDAVVGSVSRTARSLDPSARTLLTEVQIDNAGHRVMPGMYAQVAFASPRTGQPLLVPGEAVIARSNGLSIATVEDLRDEDRQRLPKQEKTKDDKDRQDLNQAKRIHLQQVQTGRDYGTEVEITRGLEPDAVIVANPGDDVAEGVLVMPQRRKPADQESGKLDRDHPPSGDQSPSMKAPTKKK